MIIIKARYHRFNPFTLAGIKTLDVTFKELLQILNSTNGTGKSTFLKELNIFPVEKDLFFEDGYKEITVKDNEDSNEQYIFKSTAKGNNSCIKVNLDTGEETELNKGGTQKVQLELAMSLFKVNPFIWDCITGVNKFTDADKTTRRNWMELISGLDFDYAFDVHKRLIRAVSERKGTIKMSSNHLAEESGKLIDEDKLLTLQKELNRLNVIYKELLTESKSVSGDAMQTIHRLTNITKEINTLHNQILKFKRNKKLNYKGTLPGLLELDSLISSKRTLLPTIEDKRNILTKQLVEKQELKEKLKRTDGYNLEKVRDLLAQGNKKRQKLIEELSEHTRRIFPMDYPNSWHDYLSKLKQTQQRLIQWSDSLENISSLTYPLPKELAEQAKEQSHELKLRIGRGEVMLESLNEQHHHLLHTPDTECPQCKHHFKPNLTGTVEECNVKIASVNRQLKQLKFNLAETDKQFGEYNKIDKARTLLTAIYLQSGFDFLLTTLDLDNTTPSGTIYPVSRVLEDESILMELKEVILKLQQLDKIEIELVSREDMGGNVETVDSSITELNSQIAKLNIDYDNIVSEMKQLETHRGNLLAVERSYQDLIGKTETYLHLKRELKEQLEYELTNEALTKISNRIGRLNAQIGDDRVVRAIVGDLAKQISKYKAELEDYVVLEKALNPTTGLIGDQLRDCTGAFAKQLTKVIDGIWGYALEVLPCSEENIKGMDYKFPFRVEGFNKPPTSDVSKGSKSQKAIINLGVQLTTRAALGFNQMPLFLDEIGEGFDQVHNENLLRFLKQLLVNYRCSNMFLVHHDVMMRSTLGDFDMVVFHKEHVTVADNYNEHALITYY